jgi:hypothetical protein
MCLVLTQFFPNFFDPWSAEPTVLGNNWYGGLTILTFYYYSEIQKDS